MTSQPDVPCARGGVSRRTLLAATAGAVALGVGGATAWPSGPVAKARVGALPGLMTTPAYRRHLVFDTYGRDGSAYGEGFGFVTPTGQRHIGGTSGLFSAIEDFVARKSAKA